MASFPRFQRVFANITDGRLLRRGSERGFLLPTVIALGLGIGTVSVLALQTVATNSATLNTSSYNILAREAAKAGVQAAAACLSSTTAADHNWAGKVLRSADCTGSNPASTTGYLDIASGDQYTTRFSVTPPDTSIPQTVTVTSTGSVVIDGPNGQPVKTITATVRAFAKTATAASNALPVDRISIGQATVCALADNWAYCWGSNGNGMLGNGWNYLNNRSTIPISIAKANQPAQTTSVANPCDSNIFTSIPSCAGAQISSIGSDRKITKISVGTDHICVIATDTTGNDGRAHCWGNNDYGQLGTRNTTDTKVPVAVNTAPYVPAEVSTGQCGGFFQRACNPAVPASAIHGRSVTDITAGNGFTCALMDNSQVACWGRNDYGQLGNDSLNNSSYPTLISYATTSRTECLVWEDHLFGPDTCESSRVHGVSALVGKPVKALANIKDAATMCVTDTDDKAYCWGQNFAGQAGDSSALPPRGTGRGSASGSGHCGSSEQQVRRNAIRGASGYDTDRLRPVAVQPSLTFSQMTISSSSSNIDVKNYDSDTDLSIRVTALTTSTGTTPLRVYYWGGTVEFNVSSSCSSDGDTYGNDHFNARASASATYTGTSTPTGPLYNDASGTTINQKPLTHSSGNAYNGLFCAATGSDIYCHGRGQTGREGQLGNGVNYADTCQWWDIFCNPPTLPSAPVVVSRTNLLPGLTLDELDTSTSGYSCAAASDSVYCWGPNGSGQLGDGTTTNRILPTPVATTLASGSALYTPVVRTGAPRDWVYF